MNTLKDEESWWSKFYDKCYLAQRGVSSVRGSGRLKLEG
jgi:hypothetical protein